MVPEVVALARVMREGGARVGTGEVEAAARALGVVGASRRDAYLGLRAVLCSRREDLAVFDAAFALIFGAPSDGSQPIEQPELPPGTTAALPRTAIDEPAATMEGEPEVRPAAWSPVELLLDKDFAEYTDA